MLQLLKAKAVPKGKLPLDLSAAALCTSSSPGTTCIWSHPLLSFFPHKGATVLTCGPKAAQRRAQRGTQRAAAPEAQGGVGRLGRALGEEGAALGIAAERVAVEGAGCQVVGGLLLRLGLRLLSSQRPKWSVCRSCQAARCAVG